MSQCTRSRMIFTLFQTSCRYHNYKSLSWFCLATVNLISRQPCRQLVEMWFIFCFFHRHSNKVEELPCKNPVPPCWWLSVAGLSSRYRLQFFQTPQTLVLRGGVVFLCLFQRAAAVSADLLPGGRISISGLNQGGQINHSKSSSSWTCAMICVILSGSRRRAY